jgi:hypothetical protein
VELWLVARSFGKERGLPRPTAPPPQARNALTAGTASALESCANYEGGTRLDVTGVVWISLCCPATLNVKPPGAEGTLNPLRTGAGKFNHLRLG